MFRINFKEKKNVNQEFASEVVEILEEKIEEMQIDLPSNLLDNTEEQTKFRNDIRSELIYEIADFISNNMKVLNRQIA